MSRPPPYRPELDVLRFAAFGTVFLRHGIPESDGLLGVVRESCGFGLPLFFMLSAFLICGNLSREKARTGSVDVASFYRRRCLRIWPLYFFGIMLSIVFDSATGNVPPSLGMIAAMSTLTTDLYYSLWTHRFSVSTASPLWSISIEEQFYLLYPLVVATFGRKDQWVVCVVTLATSSAVQAGMGFAHFERSATIWTNPLVHAEFIAVGTMLAMWFRDRALDVGASSRMALGFAAPTLWLASVATGCTQVGAAPSGVSVFVGYQLATAGCVSALLSLYGAKARMPKVLVWLGSVSYGLYVFHLYGIRLAQMLVDANTAVVLTVAMGTTVVLAAGSYRYLEEPFLRLKSRNWTWRGMPVLSTGGAELRRADVPAADVEAALIRLSA